MTNRIHTKDFHGFINFANDSFELNCSMDNNNWPCRLENKEKLDDSIILCLKCRPGSWMIKLLSHFHENNPITFFVLLIRFVTLLMIFFLIFLFIYDDQIGPGLNFPNPLWYLEYFLSEMEIETIETLAIFTALCLYYTFRPFIFNYIRGPIFSIFSFINFAFLGIFIAKTMIWTFFQSRGIFVWLWIYFCFAIHTISRYFRTITISLCKCFHEWNFKMNEFCNWIE